MDVDVSALSKNAWSSARISSQLSVHNPLHFVRELLASVRHKNPILPPQQLSRVLLSFLTLRRHLLHDLSRDIDDLLEECAVFSPAESDHGNWQWVRVIAKIMRGFAANSGCVKTEEEQSDVKELLEMIHEAEKKRKLNGLYPAEAKYLDGSLFPESYKDEIREQNHFLVKEPVTFDDPSPLKIKISIGGSTPMVSQPNSAKSSSSRVGRSLGNHHNIRNPNRKNRPGPLRRIKQPTLKKEDRIQNFFAKRHSQTQRTSKIKVMTAKEADALEEERKRAHDEKKIQKQREREERRQTEYREKIEKNARKREEKALREQERFAKKTRLNGIRPPPDPAGVKESAAQSLANKINLPIGSFQSLSPPTPTASASTPPIKKPRIGAPSPASGIGIPPISIPRSPAVQSSNPLPSPMQSNNPISSPMQSNNPISSPIQSNNPLPSPMQTNNPLPSPMQSHAPQSPFAITPTAAATHTPTASGQPSPFGFQSNPFFQQQRFQPQPQQQQQQQQQQQRFQPQQQQQQQSQALLRQQMLFRQQAQQKANQPRSASTPTPTYPFASRQAMPSSGAAPPPPPPPPVAPSRAPQHQSQPPPSRQRLELPSQLPQSQQQIMMHRQPVQQVPQYRMQQPSSTPPAVGSSSPQAWQQANQNMHMQQRRIASQLPRQHFQPFQQSSVAPPPPGSAGFQHSMHQPSSSAGSNAAPGSSPKTPSSVSSTSARSHVARAPAVRSPVVRPPPVSVPAVRSPGARSSTSKAPTASSTTSGKHFPVASSPSAASVKSRSGKLPTASNGAVPPAPPPPAYPTGYMNGKSR